MPWDCGLRQIFLVPSISPGVDISQDRWLFPTERCQMFAQPRSILFQVLSHLLLKYISLARQKIKETAWNLATIEGSHSRGSPVSFSGTDISLGGGEGSKMPLWREHSRAQVSCRISCDTCTSLLACQRVFALRLPKSWALNLHTPNRCCKKMRCKGEGGGAEVALRRGHREAESCPSLEDWSISFNHKPMSVWRPFVVSDTNALWAFSAEISGEQRTFQRVARDVFILFSLLVAIFSWACLVTV